MSERLEAYGGRIVVRPDKPPERTAKGLHLPAQAQDAPKRGKVIGVGPEIGLGESVVSEGDTVVYSKYAGVSMEVDGENLLVLAEGDVLGRIVTD